jgi:hypothetical protein
MVEHIPNMTELEKKYEVVTGRRPKVNDLVYIPAFEAVYEVINVDRLYVKIERGHKGSGLLVKLPVNYYKIVELKRKKK